MNILLGLGAGIYGKLLTPKVTLREDDSQIEPKTFA